MVVSIFSTSVSEVSSTSECWELVLHEKSPIIMTKIEKVLIVRLIILYFFKVKFVINNYKIVSKANKDSLFTNFFFGLMNKKRMP